MCEIIGEKWIKNRETEILKTERNDEKIQWKRSIMETKKDEIADYNIRQQKELEERIGDNVMIISKSIETYKHLYTLI